MKSGKRKHSLALFTILILISSLLLSACGQAVKPEEKVSTVEAPARGGEATFSLPGDPTTFLVGTASQPGGVHNILYPGLVRLDNDNKPQPYVAESWEISPDSKTIKFNLRKNIKWYDGKPLTSADVKWTFEQVSAKLTSQLIPAFKQVKSIETPDEYTVVLNFTVPYGPLFSVLADPFFGVLPKHILEGKDLLTDPAAKFSQIGAGPFKIKEWRKGEYIIMERNPDFWEQSKPYLDQVVFRIIPDPTARLNAFETGVIDQVEASGILEHVKRLTARPGVANKSGSATPSDTDLTFNLKNPILANLEVRKAIFQAIDRNMINSMVYEGLAAPGVSFIDPQFGALYNSNIDFMKMYPYDPAKAEQMLDQAGYPRGADGTRFKLNFTTASIYADLLSTQEMIVEFLKKVGIMVTPDKYDIPGIVERIYKAHNFDLFLFTTTAGADPSIGVDRWFNSASYGTGQQMVNASGYANKKVDELFTKARTSAVQQDRISMFHEIQDITSKELPFLKIMNPPVINLYNKRLQNLLVNGPYIHDRLESVWVKK